MVMSTLSDLLATLSPARRAAVEARARELVEEERRRTYMRAGEVVTCENGHEIADVVRDAVRHEMPSVKQFANWRNVEREPQKGERPQLMRCTVCGARFCFGYDHGGAIFHIGARWRTDKPEHWGLNPDETSTAP